MLLVIMKALTLLKFLRTCLTSPSAPLPLFYRTEFIKVIWFFQRTPTLRLYMLVLGKFFSND